jgi:hypothetical protein
MACRQHCDKEKQNQMIPFHGDKKNHVSAMQNYHIYQAIEWAVQTILELKNCNILVMNGLKFCLFQTFSGKSQEFGCV